MGIDNESSTENILFKKPNVSTNSEGMKTYCKASKKFS